MPFITKEIVTSCIPDLLTAVNQLSMPSCKQIINNGDGSLTFDFSSDISTADNDMLDSLLDTWACPIHTETMLTGSYKIDDTDESNVVLWSSEKIKNEIQDSVIERVYYAMNISSGSTTNRYGYTNFLTLDIDNAIPGIYRISCSFSAWSSNGGKSCDVRLYDNTNDYELFGVEINQNKAHQVSDFIYYTITTDTQINIQWKSEHWNAAYIKNAKIEAWRVKE